MRRNQEHHSTTKINKIFNWYVHILFSIPLKFQAKDEFFYCPWSDARRCFMCFFICTHCCKSGHIGTFCVSRPIIKIDILFSPCNVFLFEFYPFSLIFIYTSQDYRISPLEIYVGSRLFVYPRNLMLEQHNKTHSEHRVCLRLFCNKLPQKHVITSYHIPTFSFLTLPVIGEM